MDFTKNREAFLALPKPKAVIFDWDNTLVDTWPLIQHAIDTTMIAMGKQPWGLEKVRNEVHKSMRESFPEIFGDRWQEAGEIYKNTYRSTHLDHICFLPSALDLINSLYNAEILQFVVSNKIGITLRKEVKKLQVAEKFFAVIGATDANSDKPSAAPVELALMGSGIDPKKDEVWFVGDTIADIECAYNSGCRPIVFGHSDNQISKTISPQDMAGRNGALPLYFDHAELVKIISAGK